MKTYDLYMSIIIIPDIWYDFYFGYKHIIFTITFNFDKSEYLNAALELF